MTSTLKDVARHSGLSVQTVSCVLNNRGNLYRPATRQRVIDSAKQLGYRPNALARATRTGRSGTIALAMATNAHRSNLPIQMLQGIEQQLGETEGRLLLAPLPDDKLTSEGYIPQILREWLADGLLINYQINIPPRMVELIRRHQIPSVWLNSRQAADCIYPDEHDAGHRATQHLLAMGHRRIAYLDLSHAEPELADAHFSTIDRQAGYETAMADAGLATQVVRTKEHVQRDHRLAFCRQWLEQGDRPTAVLCHADATAVPLAAAAHQLRLRIPEDLSLVSFGDVPDRLVAGCMTTLIVPQHELGRQAVQMLYRKIKSPARPLKPMIVPFEMDPGSTCAPPQ
ncbi:MAG: LacI family DNA-binding transcriptional regulator [Phycisphaeraceae bacterium]